MHDQILDSNFQIKVIHDNGEVETVTRKLSDKDPDRTIYTDRLYQWDHEKHDRLCKKHFGDTGQVWRYRDPEAIEAFLCDWLDKEVEIVTIEPQIHQARGYKLCRIDYTECA